QVTVVTDRPFCWPVSGRYAVIRSTAARVAIDEKIAGFIPRSDSSVHEVWAHAAASARETCVLRPRNVKDTGAARVSAVMAVREHRGCVIAACPEVASATMPGRGRPIVCPMDTPRVR